MKKIVEFFFCNKNFNFYWLTRKQNVYLSTLNVYQSSALQLFFPQNSIYTIYDIILNLSQNAIISGGIDNYFTLVGDD